MVYGCLNQSHQEALLRIPVPKNLRPYNQNQMELFPPNVRRLIADDDLCLVVNDVVDILDLSCLYIKVSHEGNRPYHPAMMLKVLFYAYAKGVFSSRKIAAALKEHVGFIFLAAWQKPDFRTINDFRKNNLEELGLLFSQMVLLCRELGMVKLGHVAIDGTKIKANASDAASYDQRRIHREISRWLDRAKEIDHEEDSQFGATQSGDELPEEIRDQEERINRLRALQQRLSQSERAKVNKTDPDASFMKSRSGIRTSYNAQTVVDADHQVIVAADVTDEANDVDQLLPMIEQAEANLSDHVQECSADAGYSSGENLKALETRKTDGYVPDRTYQGQKRSKSVGDFHKAHFVFHPESDCYLCPEGEELSFTHLQKRKGKEPLRIYRGRNCNSCRYFGICTRSQKGRSLSRHPYEEELAQMRRKLDSESGRTIYGQRKHVVEPPFGHIKSIMGFRQFSLRGSPKVKAEFKLVSIAHNLRKICFYLKSKGETLADLCPQSAYRPC